MRNERFRWVLGAVVIAGILLFPVLYFLPRSEPPADDPWRFVPRRLPHTDHRALMTGPYPDGPSVTRACLECHEEAGREMMRTAHWNWEGDPVVLPGRSEPVRLGKKNVVNNFCISVQSNWYGCTSCHAGYGWEDGSFDFTNVENVDCLVCHERTGSYVKAEGGYPAPGVDLVEAAGSVGSPTRENCGGCHFRGGGGDAVKHGDLDGSLRNPRERIDVHMGRHGMLCIDCHKTQNHVIAGRSISVSVDNSNRLRCVDCHATEPHRDARLNAHTAAVACQTCHIPEVALREATKVHWDWSAAGQDLGDDPRVYLKKKGRFVYAKYLAPEYDWFDGTADRYLLGDRVDTTAATPLNPPRGEIGDPASAIWPFKVHRGKQIYDRAHRYLLVPKTVGEGGFWEEFDWDRAARLGSETTKLPYSGSYGFARTEMFWPLTHMVAPKEKSLPCGDCHAEDGVLDWIALGYPGDPVHWGGRVAHLEAASERGASRP
ncbi:MAG: tetrathionate reductase family octaheme c-type cytochrome [Candidatus Eisenbacteria bacterium]